MALRLRWFMVVLCLVVVGAGTALFAQALQDSLRVTARTAVMQREVRALEQDIEMVRGEQAQIESWREMARLCRQAGLEPDKWRSYPVSIARDLPWEDMAGIILIASNSLPRPSDYWFQPSVLRVVRAELNPEADAQPAGSGRASAPELYSLRFEGNFFIPERSRP